MSMYDETLIKDEINELFKCSDADMLLFRHSVLLPMAVYVEKYGRSIFGSASKGLQQIQLSQLISLLNFLATAPRLEKINQIKEVLLAFMAWQSIETRTKSSWPNRYNNVSDLFKALPASVNLQVVSSAPPTFYRLIKNLRKTRFHKNYESLINSWSWSSEEIKSFTAKSYIRQVISSYAQRAKSSPKSAFTKKGGLKTTSVRSKTGLHFWIYSSPLSFSDFLSNADVSVWVPAEQASYALNGGTIKAQNWKALEQFVQDSFALSALEDEKAKSRAKELLQGMSEKDRNLLKDYFQKGGS